MTMNADALAFLHSADGVLNTQTVLTNVLVTFLFGMSPPPSRRLRLFRALTVFARLLTGVVCMLAGTSVFFL